MKIQSLSIRNYKCHRSVDKIPFRDFTTLIGENDCGKTAIIDFLEIMLTNKIPRDEDYFRYIDLTSSDQPSEVTANEISGEIVLSIDENEEHTLADYLNEQKSFHLRKVFTPEGSTSCVYTKKFSDSRFYNYMTMTASDLQAFVEELGFTEENGFKFKNQTDRKAEVQKYLQERASDIPTTLGWTEVKMILFCTKSKKRLKLSHFRYSGSNAGFCLL